VYRRCASRRGEGCALRQGTRAWRTVLSTVAVMVLYRGRGAPRQGGEAPACPGRRGAGRGQGYTGASPRRTPAEEERVAAAPRCAPSGGVRVYRGRQGGKRGGLLSAHKHTQAGGAGGGPVYTPTPPSPLPSSNPLTAHPAGACRHASSGQGSLPGRAAWGRRLGSGRVAAQDTRASRATSTSSRPSQQRLYQQRQEPAGQRGLGWETRKALGSSPYRDTQAEGTPLTVTPPTVGASQVYPQAQGLRPPAYLQASGMLPGLLTTGPERFPERSCRPALPPSAGGAGGVLGRQLSGVPLEHNTGGLLAPGQAASQALP